MTTATAAKPAVRVRIEYDDLVMHPRDPTYSPHESVFGDWHRRDSPGDEKIEGIETVLARVSPAGEPEKIAEWFEQEQDRLRELFKLSWIDVWDGRMTSDQKAYFRDLRQRMHEKQRELLDKHCVWLPVFMLDHSGVKLQTRSFNIAWDSGQVGFIWIDRNGIANQWDWKVLTKKRRQAVAKSLEIEIEVLSQYMSGDVYYAVLEDEDGNEVEGTESSCGGFFGTDWKTNGIFDFIPEHLRDTTKWKFPWN